MQGSPATQALEETAPDPAAASSEVTEGQGKATRPLGCTEVSDVLQKAQGSYQSWCV